MSRFLRGCVVLILLVSPVSAWAQAAPGVALELDFLNPGARNLALAGVAAGLSDDATAVLTNPAGLSILARPEISVEYRVKNVSFDYLSGGSFTSPQFAEFSHTNHGLNFLSVVVPAGRVVFGAYRHELSRLNVNLARGDVRGQGFTFLSPPPFERTYDFTSFGGSVGVKLSNQFSIGAGINATQFKSDTSRPNSVDDVGIGGIVGLHITPAPKFRFGLSYRRGAELDLGEASLNPDAPVLRVPDVLSAGFTVRPTDAFLIAIDVSRVKYSDIEALYYLDDPVSILDVPDATEFHAAAEYVFTNSSLLPSIRFGTWFDPSHSPEVIEIQPLLRASPVPRREFANLVYQPTDDVWHVTGGVGIVPKTGFELNVGVDISSKAKLFSTSAIFRF